jgi:hypothetical protein
LRIRPKRFVGDTIFVAEDCSSVPLLRGVIRWPSLGEAGYVVLDFFIEPLAEFQDNVCPLEIASMLHYLAKIIDVLIDTSSTLEELRGFEIGPGRLDFVFRAEFGDEFVDELLP